MSILTYQNKNKMEFRNERERFEAIERYCLKEMTGFELNAFQELLKNDIELQKEIEDFNWSYKIIKDTAIEQQMLDTLARHKSEEKHETFNVILFWKRNWRKVTYGLTAACLAFVLYSSVSLVQLPGSENDLTIVRDVDPNVLSPLQKSTYDHFYAGQSHVIEGQYNAATKDFEEVLKTPNLRPYFREATQWHLIIAYLKANEAQKAKTLYKDLQTINKPVYPIGVYNKFKIWLQIFWSNIFS